MLSSLTGITQPQLSRIESGKSKITLFSLIRILYALKVYYPTLFSLGIIKNSETVSYFLSEFQYADDGIATFTVRDIENFIVFRANAQPIFEKWLAYFLTAGVHFSEEAASLLLNDAMQLMTRPPRKPFHDTNIKRVIYPIDLGLEIIRCNAASGGALLSYDIRTFLHATRIQKGISPDTLANMVQRSKTGIYYIEGNIGARTNFEDILNLDWALNVNGELFTIAWRVGELYLGINRDWTNTKQPVAYTEDQIGWFTRLLVLLRLLQHQGLLTEAENYVSEIRAKAIPNP